jgi:hypothetical protein
MFMVVSPIHISSPCRARWLPETQACLEESCEAVMARHYRWRTEETKNVRYVPALECQIIPQAILQFSRGP